MTNSRLGKKTDKFVSYSRVTAEANILKLSKAKEELEKSLAKQMVETENTIQKTEN